MLSITIIRVFGRLMRFVGAMRFGPSETTPLDSRGICFSDTATIADTVLKNSIPLRLIGFRPTALNGR
jgi:hypothetical protein